MKKRGICLWVRAAMTREIVHIMQGKVAWLCTLISLLFIYAEVSLAATIVAKSASYIDVSDAVASASSGDMVLVPVGSASWNNQLVITKGIMLYGSGADKTIISSNYVWPNPGSTFDESNWLIVYYPSNPQANEPFRLSGFTLDLRNNCQGILVKNSSTSVINRIRIDHNIIRNGSGRNIMIYGTVYGVIDNNNMSGGSKQIDAYGLNSTSWDNFNFQFGTPDNIYYEDNTFTITNTPHSGGMGGRYCSRYNAYIHRGESGLYPWFDMHGNQGIGKNHATMGAEIYGNSVAMTFNKGVGMIDQRGGKVLFFLNTAITEGSVTAKVREEYDDALNPTSNPQPQHVNESYFWNNTKKGVSVIKITEQEDCCNAIEENRNFYNYDDKFNGTVGVGVGSLAARPSTCTAGVGYWATDVNVFYLCASSNNWSFYYTPYTYPHPLRSAFPEPPKGSVSAPAGLRLK